MPAAPQQLVGSSCATSVEAGDLREQAARRVAHALAVHEMAGVVVADASLDAARRRAQAGGVEELADVAHRGGEAARRRRAARGPPRASRRRSRRSSPPRRRRPLRRTPRRCGARDRPRSADRRRARAARRSSPALRARRRRSRSRRARAPWRRSRRRRARASRSRRRARRDRAARPAPGSSSGSARRALRGGTRGAASLSSRSARGSSGRASRSSRSRCSEREQIDERAQAARPRHDLAQREALDALREAAAQPRVLDRGARAFDEPAEAHARRTRRLAGATAETEIRLVGDAGVERQPSLGDGAHQVDAPARRRSSRARSRDTSGTPAGRARSARSRACPVEIGERAGRRAGRLLPPSESSDVATGIQDAGGIEARLQRARESPLVARDRRTRRARSSPRAARLRAPRCRAPARAAARIASQARSTPAVSATVSSAMRAVTSPAPG